MLCRRCLGIDFREEDREKRRCCTFIVHVMLDEIQIRRSEEAFVLLLLTNNRLQLCTGMHLCLCMCLLVMNRFVNCLIAADRAANVMMRGGMFALRDFEIFFRGSADCRHWFLCV